uniref:Uncharacterized protein n=1 Tax=Romanomermis culicivorax TaxID=13658 RepID=A0A915J442_ROMCU
MLRLMCLDRFKMDCILPFSKALINVPIMRHQRLTQAQFSKHIDNRFHRRLIRYRYRSLNKEKMRRMTFSSNRRYIKIAPSHITHEIVHFAGHNDRKSAVFGLSQKFFDIAYGHSLLNDNFQVGITGQRIFDRIHVEQSEFFVQNGKLDLENIILIERNLASKLSLEKHEIDKMKIENCQTEKKY